MNADIDLYNEDAPNLPRRKSQRHRYVKNLWFKTIAAFELIRCRNANLANDIRCKIHCELTYLQLLHRSAMHVLT